MADVPTRLRQCFASVFPDLPTDEIEDATPESVEAWDSLANATLVTVIEEEFELEFSPDEVGDLTSFDALAGYLERHVESYVGE